MPDITVHFDISGSIEDCSAFMQMIGFPVSTSMSKQEQDAVAVDENAVADRLEAAKQKAQTLGKP